MLILNYSVMTQKASPCHPASLSFQVIIIPIIIIITHLIDPVVHNKNKINQSINHNNIKCLYNQLNAHAHFVFTAQPSVLGKVRACQCTLRRDTVSLYLALGVLAPRVSDAVDASSSPRVGWVGKFFWLGKPMSQSFRTQQITCVNMLSLKHHMWKTMAWEN